MDLLAALNTKIDSLPDGEYVRGLRSVLSHIEIAFEHLERGRTSNQDSAFNDAIYRTNQAFEGSVKEAYRVFNSCDPGNKSTFDIEKFLEEKNKLKPRVLSLFSNYRKEWRNPSTHDYILCFDENEAFLAVISVTAFTCLLVDQILSHLSYDAVKSETKGKIKSKDGNEALIDVIKRAALALPNQINQNKFIMFSESSAISSMAGIISAISPNAKIEMESSLSNESNARADLLVSDGNNKVIIEMKRSYFTTSALALGKSQLEKYMSISGILNGVLVFAPHESKDLEITEHESSIPEGKIIVISPKKNS